jgi:hypothetical protein
MFLCYAFWCNVSDEAARNKRILFLLTTSMK